MTPDRGDPRHSEPAIKKIFAMRRRVHQSRIHVSGAVGICDILAGVIHTQRADQRYSLEQRRLAREVVLQLSVLDHQTGMLSRRLAHRSVTSKRWPAAHRSAL